jgi:Xaa-Pro dipeptidase
MGRANASLMINSAIPITAPRDHANTTDNRRNFIAGGSLFFTVNLAERHPMHSKATGFARAQPIRALRRSRMAVCWKQYKVGVTDATLMETGTLSGTRGEIMTISVSEYADRLRRLQQQLLELDVDVFIVTARDSIYYLTGAGFEPLERPFFMLVSKTGSPLLITPMLDRDHLSKAHNIDQASLKTYWDYPAPSGKGWREVLLDLVGSTATIGIEPSLRIEIRLALPERARMLPLIEELRLIKTPAEIDMIRRAAVYADAAVQQILAAAYYGSTVAEGLARSRHVTAAMIRDVPDWEPADSNVLMATWVAPRSAQPHSIPALSDQAREGPHVALALTRCNGYAAECERTFFTSSPTKWALAAFKAMTAARQLAMKLVRPGKPCAELDREVTDFLRGEGFFGPERRLHRIGHGFGLGNHEAPWISDGSDNVLAENMVISIEPGIYDANQGGVRHSDTILVTRDGPVRLTNSSDRLDDLIITGLRLRSRISGALIRRALRISPPRQTVS